MSGLRSLALAIAVTSCGGRSIPPSVPHPLAGAAAPEFHRESTDARDVGVPGSDRTKVTVVDFWASWCGACQETMPALDRLWRERREEGLMVIGVSVDERASDATAMAAELGATFPVVLDPSTRLAATYGVQKVPLTFVIDSAGTVRWVGRDPALARRAVEAVLGEAEAAAAGALGLIMARRPKAGPPPGGQTLFDAAARADPALRAGMPLAERVRPRALDEVLGQEHLLGAGKLLARAIAADRVPSMILWGPPGSGKTTLARVIAERTDARFVPFSAVLGGVAEVREIVAAAAEARSYGGKRTILFVDEIHRFNKAQQDAFLPHVEDGTITLIGATTENPSFAVNAPLLSRCKVFRLKPLGPAELIELMRRALGSTRGLSGRVAAEDDALEAIAALAQGDARRALTTLEVAAGDAEDQGDATITRAAVTAASEHKPLLYDKSGEEHYNVISAFIKSMRGSDPDAAIYWLMRMVEAGDDPMFLLRRMLIFASEDIGNADPRALEVAVAADAAFRRLGMPEGMYPLAHAAIYLATAPKSNACNVAWHQAQAAVRELGALEVPMKLRNAVTPLMKQEGYGAGYKYAHDEEGGVAEGEAYLPDALGGRRFYEPTDRGYERAIAERLKRIPGRVGLRATSSHAS